MGKELKKIELAKILLLHRKLAEKRSYNYETNSKIKYILYFSMICIIMYLMFIAVMFSLIVNDSRSISAVEFACVILPFILVIDFALRFLVQQTPAQIIKPYILLPLPQNICLDTFIFKSIFNWGNMIWLALFLPYCLMSVVFGYGIITTAILVAYIIVLILANSQWYAIVRVLINDSLWWWLLPLGVYALEMLPIYINGDPNFTPFQKFYSSFGSAIELHNLLPLIGAVTLFCILTIINRKLQNYYTKREITDIRQDTKPKKIGRYAFLERFGELGTYLQLEIKLTLRNKNPRKSFIFNSAGVVAISLIIVFTEIYDSKYMTNFWALYNFVLYGSTQTMRIMCYEGNYIDGLMVRREQIFALLRAKYLYMCLLLIVPFILMLPVVYSGKWSLYMLISYALFTMGFQYFILFHMAIFNKQTIPLNEKLTSVKGTDNSYTQIFVTSLIFILPNALVGVLQNFLSDNIAFSIMLVVGIGFIATSRQWLYHIYKRMMKRRYENLEAFKASR